jgi:hypothetical protein
LIYLDSTEFDKLASPNPKASVAVAERRLEELSLSDYVSSITKIMNQTKPSPLIDNWQDTVFTELYNVSLFLSSRLVSFANYCATRASRQITDANVLKNDATPTVGLELWMTRWADSFKINAPTSIQLWDRSAVVEMLWLAQVVLLVLLVFMPTRFNALEKYNQCMILAGLMWWVIFNEVSSSRI